MLRPGCFDTDVDKGDKEAASFYDCLLYGCSEPI